MKFFKVISVLALVLSIIALAHSFTHSHPFVPHKHKHADVLTIEESFALYDLSKDYDKKIQERSDKILENKIDAFLAKKTIKTQDRAS